MLKALQVQDMKEEYKKKDNWKLFSVSLPCSEFQKDF